jgi:hypothetical protein
VTGLPKPSAAAAADANGMGQALMLGSISLTPRATAIVASSVLSILPIAVNV